MRRINLQQNSPEWHTWRKSIIGASDCPVIMVDNHPYKTLRQLYDEKKGLYEQPQTEAMRAGNAMESEIRERVSKELGIDFEPGCYQSDLYSWCGSSLDGINFNEDTYIEIKVNNRDHHQIALNNKIPVFHEFQMQHQWISLDGKAMDAYYCSYHMGDLKIVPFSSCSFVMSEIVEESEKFWKMLKDETPPALTDRDYEKIDSEYLILESQGYEEAKRQLKYWEDRVEAHKKAIVEGAGRNALVGNLRLTKGQRKGAVNYSSIPEIRGVDLEQYRKPPITVWTLE